MKNKLKPPKASFSDGMHAILKAGIASTPFIGGAATELFSFVVTPSLERRRNEWMEAVADTINGLIDTNKEVLARLNWNEHFVSILMSASQIALRTHERDKLTALRNGIISSVLQLTPSEAIEFIYLKLIDDFTAFHLSVIQTIKKSSSLEWVEDAEDMDYLDWTHSIYPIFSGDDALLSRVIRDLEKSDIIRIDNNRDEDKFMHSLTQFGDGFANFIGKPGQI